MTRVPWLALMFATTAGCSAIWGFEDGQLAQDAGQGDDDDDGMDSSPGRTDGKPNVDLDAQSDAAPPGCSGRVIDPLGLFVDQNEGADSELCGPPELPCRSIGYALEHYQARFHPFVHVALGDYAESLVVPAVFQQLGLTIEGRWSVRFVGAQRSWAPYCGDVPTRVLGQSATAIRVDSTYFPTDPSPFPTDGGGDASDGASAPYDLVLSNLELEGRAAGSGESMYGVFARRAHVSLSDVVVTAPAGGNGAAGAMGSLGADATDNDCEPNPQVPVGMDGPDAPPAPPGPDLVGAFGPDGYGLASNAKPGPLGATGSNGGLKTCTVPLLAAKSGCGGSGGFGGAPGQLGGASVALYLSDSKADLTRVRLLARGGGNGGQGGSGGAGGAGIQGAGGVGVCEGLGLFGSKGGRGGTGGTGPSGPGGPSYCAAAVGASPAPAPFPCDPGVGGAPGNATAGAGNSGDLYTEGDGGSQAPP